MRPRSRINSCRSKIAYGTWAKALSDAKRMNRMYDETLWPYRCSYCGVDSLRPCGPGTQGPAAA